MSDQKSKFNLEKILELSKQGLQLKDIAERLGMNAQMLSYHLNKKGIDIPKRRKCQVIDEFFDNIDTEIKAYLLGYFVADGCICIENKKHNGIIDGHSTRLLLNVSEDDISVIELFKENIIPNGTINKSNCQRGVKFKRKPQVKLRWVSKHMANTLNTYNIKPNKTLDSQFIIPDGAIKEELWRHFIRGYFDGDGCICHVNIKEHVYKRVSFVFTSLPFAEQVMKKMQVPHNIRTVQGKTCIWYDCRILGGKSIVNKIKDYFYKNSVYYLQRKFLKF